MKQNNDLLTLYNTVANFNLPFYAKKTHWVHAYVRIDKFINSIPCGTYFNHPTYKCGDECMIYDSRNTDWVIITDFEK